MVLFIVASEPRTVLDTQKAPSKCLLVEGRADKSVLRMWSRHALPPHALRPSLSSCQLDLDFALSPRGHVHPACIYYLSFGLPSS